MQPLWYKEDFLLSDEKVSALKEKLDKQDRKRIKILEEDCSNLDLDYWEIYRRVGEDRIGRYFTSKTLREYYELPLSRLKMNLLHKAAQLRGVKFSE